LFVFAQNALEVDIFRSKVKKIFIFIPVFFSYK